MEVVIAAIVSAILGPLLLSWRTRRDLKNRVGTPNGNGNVVTMLEHVIAGQGAQNERLGRIEARQGEVEQRLSRLDGQRVA